MTAQTDARRRSRVPDPDAQMIAQLRRIADGFHFTATRVGAPGCAVRLEASDNEQALLWAIEKMTRTEDE